MVWSLCLMSINLKNIFFFNGLSPFKIIKAAEREKNIQINFNHKLISADFENCKMVFVK